MSQEYTLQKCIKISSLNDIDKLQSIFKDLKKQSPFRLAGRLKYIMALFTGTSNSNGLLPLLAEQAFKKSPQQWVDKMQKIMKYIGPESQFVQILKNNRYLRISIDKQILPPHLKNKNISKESNNSYINEYQGILNMIQGQQQSSLLAIDWYYTTILIALYQQDYFTNYYTLFKNHSYHNKNNNINNNNKNTNNNQYYYGSYNTKTINNNNNNFIISSPITTIMMKNIPISQNISKTRDNKNTNTYFQIFMQDDFYYILARHPYLILLRKNLQANNQNSQQRYKLISLIKQYFIYPFLIKYQYFIKNGGQKGYRNSSTGYRNTYNNDSGNFQLLLKINGILSIYLALGFHSSLINKNNNYINNMNISNNLKNNLENFFKISIHKNNQLCNYNNNNEQKLIPRYLIRLWLFFMKSTENFQKLVISNLSKANSKYGWFSFQRYSVKSFQDYIQNKNKNILSSFLYNNYDIKSYPSFKSISQGFISLFDNQNGFYSNNVESMYTLALFFTFLNAYKKQLNQQENIINSQSLKSNRNSMDSMNSNRNINQQMNSSKLKEKDYLEMILNSKRQLSEKVQKIIQQIQRKLPQVIITQYQRLIKKQFSLFYDKLHLTIQYFYYMAQAVYQLKKHAFPGYSLQQIVARFKNKKNQQYTNRDQKIITCYVVDLKKSPWDHPVCDNQSLLLKQILYYLAKGIHLITPSFIKGKYPINIRVFSNPFRLILLIVILFLMKWVFEYLIRDENMREC